MRYKELREKVEEWGQKYGIETEIEKYEEHIEICTKSSVDGLRFSRVLASINNNKILAFNLIWGIFGEPNISKSERYDLALIIFEYAYTDPKDREDEKRFIIPLPGLVTTDGKQQYLSHKGNFFASRRDEELRQTWKEDGLKFVPEVYRQFAVEFDEDKEY